MHVLSPHVNFPSSQKNFTLLLITLNVREMCIEKISYRIEQIFKIMMKRFKDKRGEVNSDKFLCNNIKEYIFIP